MPEWTGRGRAFTFSCVRGHGGLLKHVNSTLRLKLSSLFCFVFIIITVEMRCTKPDLQIKNKYNFIFLVNNLALVKPEKATAVENHLMQMARSGQLGGKVKRIN